MDIKVRDLERGPPWGRMSHHTEGTRNQNGSDTCKEIKDFFREKKPPYSLRSLTEAGIGRQLCSLRRDTSYTHSVEWHPEVREPHGRASPSCRIKEELTPCVYAWLLLASSERSLPPKDAFLTSGDSIWTLLMCLSRNP